MMAVSEDVTEIQRYWKDLLPRTRSEEQILFHPAKKGFKGISYKDLNAQAHCIAAWLMMRGLKKGEYVGMLPGHGPASLLTDIALQFLGVIQLTWTSEHSHEQVLEQVRSHDIRFIFVPGHQQFLRHKQFMSLKDQLHTLILDTDEVDDLDPEKLVTFDAVVTHGKAAWRENVAQLESMKKAVQGNSTYAKKDEETLDYHHLLKAFHHIQSILQKNSDAALLNRLSSEKLLQRTFSFAALTLRHRLYLSHNAWGSGNVLQEIQPGFIALEPPDLTDLYHHLPGLVGQEEAVRKQMEKALAVVRKRDEAEAQGKKNPFFNKLRYRMGNQKLYAKVRARLGGKLQGFVLNQGKPEPQVEAFFRESELPMLKGLPEQ